MRQLAVHYVLQQAAEPFKQQEPCCFAGPADLQVVMKPGNQMSVMVCADPLLD